MVSEHQLFSRKAIETNLRLMCSIKELEVEIPGTLNSIGTIFL